MNPPPSTHHRPANGLTRGLRWGPLGILLFWLVLMAGLYFVMDGFLKPPPVTVTASGDLVIPRARDGHFYADGSVNGHPVRFLVDTGASMVVVSEALAQSAGLQGGQPTVFRTANGQLNGRVVGNVPVAIGPASVSGLRVGVGLLGDDSNRALLGQNFLSKFNIELSGERMVLRQKP
jgi:aspartyl protease family protein